MPLWLRILAACVAIAGAAVIMTAVLLVCVVMSAAPIEPLDW